MRTQSEAPGPSVGGDPQSIASSPTGSAVTAVSGRSSLGIGLQYRGAWCTPPRIFMDNQVFVQYADALKAVNAQQFVGLAWRNLEKYVY